MGARISADGCIAKINGVEKLHGAEVYAPDLRGGAALAVAAVHAEGKTVIGRTEHIERGYEDIVRDLKSLGADAARL